MHGMISDTELLSRLKNFEDNFVERKTASDDKDWLRTIVAFANSTPIDGLAILFIGVRDNGEIERRAVDLDSIQKKLAKLTSRTYPRIPYLTRNISCDGLQALAVMVQGSSNRPHFAGPSYIRLGSTSPEASEQQFNELIAIRNGKAYRILQYKNQAITVMNVRRTANHVDESVWGGMTRVIGCDQFCVELANGTDPKDHRSIALDRVEISHDHILNRLLLRIAT